MVIQVPTQSKGAEWGDTGHLCSKFRSPFGVAWPACVIALKWTGATVTVLCGGAQLRVFVDRWPACRIMRCVMSQAQKIRTRIMTHYRRIFFQQGIDYVATPTTGATAPVIEYAPYPLLPTLLPVLFLADSAPG